MVSKTRFLICDDHRICCLGLRVEIESLSKFKDAEFIFASSAQEAREVLKDQTFDFVFMDLKLADGSGIATIEQSTNYLENARVVLVTGETSSAAMETIHEALRVLPIHGLLQKTHSTKTLRDLFEQFEEDRHSPFICPESEALLKKTALTDLTKRELEVLGLVVKGLTTAEIAIRLGCSQETIKSHRSNMLLKTKTRNFAELSAWYSSKYNSSF
ncbi:MAG: response regulator transcription factor [Proteobacteria bacterium]|nr:MAG: response regulator transcription factor [Pseudomonadota bacterium]